MKTTIVLLVVGCLFFAGNTLFANDYTDCLKVERLKAKKKGVASVKAKKQAQKICKPKLRSKKKQTSISKDNTKKKIGVFVSLIPSVSGEYVYAQEAFNVPPPRGSHIYGTGLKVGYTLGSVVKIPVIKNFRISYAVYRLGLAGIQANSTITHRIYFLDYVFLERFYVGIGAGESHEIYEQTCSSQRGCTFVSGSGSAIPFNLGYIHKVNEHLQIGIGYIRTSFSYDYLDSKQKYTFDMYSINLNLLF